MENIKQPPINAVTEEQIQKEKEKETNYLDKHPETRLTYKDSSKVNKETDKPITLPWKPFSQCTDAEKEKYNLAQLQHDIIILDIEDKTKQVELTNKLISDKRKFYVHDSGSRGLHYHLPMPELEQYSQEERTQIRKLFFDLYKEFNPDYNVASDNTVIARPFMPHHKTLRPKTLIGCYNEDIINTLEPELIEKAIKIVERNNSIKESRTTEPVIDTFKTNPIVVWLKKLKSENKKTPSNNNTDIDFFPNLAFEIEKYNLPDEKVKQELKPLIEGVLQHKYPEFEGWRKKAKKGMIEFNPTQLNQWLERVNSILNTDTKEFYDLKPIPVNIENKKPLFRVYRNDDFVKLELPQQQYLVYPYIPKPAFTLVGSKTNSFKTMLLIFISICASRGMKLFGLDEFRTKKCNFLYLNAENASRSMLDKVKAFEKGMNLLDSNVNIYWVNMQGFQLDIKEHVEWLENFIKENKIDVVIIDTIRRSISYDDNQSDNVTKTYNMVLSRLQTQYDVAFIGLTHLRKGNAKYTPSPSELLDEFKASGEWVNVADSVICLQKDKAIQSQFVLHHLKTRDSELAKPIQLEFVATSNTITNESGQEIKIIDTANIKVVTREVTIIDEQVKAANCARVIQEWMQTSNITEFKTKTCLEYLRTHNPRYDKNNFNEAKNILYRENILEAGNLKGWHRKYRPTLQLDIAEFDAEQINNDVEGCDKQ